MQVHYNCHIQVKSYAVKRLRKVESFQFPLESSSASFVSDVGGESVPRGRTREWERSLTKFRAKAWYVEQTALSGSQRSRWPCIKLRGAPMAHFDFCL